MRTSEQINELATACAKAQQVLKPAAKDAVNPAFKSKYADLASVTEATRVYAAHGVAVFQDAISNETGVAVETRLVHTSGQWIEFGPLMVPMAKKDAHGLGSATTYAKRYALQAALQIAADEDDDANAAVGNGKPAMVRKLEPAAPAGYSEWLLDMQSTADSGFDALRKAWHASPRELREHLDRTARETWETLKAKAKAVDAKAVPA